MACPGGHNDTNPGQYSKIIEVVQTVPTAKSATVKIISGYSGL